MKLDRRTQPALGPRGWSRGQTFGEFAMIALLTIGLIFGIVSFAMTVYTYNFISNASRDAVRYAIVHGSKSASPATADDIQNFVRSEAKGITASAITVTTCWNPQNSCPGPSGNNTPGKVVSVQVSYNVHPFYPFMNLTLPLSSSAQMVISY